MFNLSQLTISEILQLLGIIASFSTSIVAIFISVITLKRNSKMIESSTRPIIGIYSDMLYNGSPQFYFVIKNFGKTPAYIKQFNTDFDFSGCFTVENLPDKDFLKSLNNTVIAPNQSKICILDFNKINQPITFNLIYGSTTKDYVEQYTIDLKAGTGLLRPVSDGKDSLKEISRTLQEMLHKNL